MSRVMIVDDDEDISTLVADILEGRGYDVVIPRDALQALAIMRSTSPDLILLDVEMPELSGPELACRLLVEDAGLERIPILLLSAVVGLEEVAAKVGTPYFLAKPFEVRRLVALVQQALEERIPPAPG